MNGGTLIKFAWIPEYPIPIPDPLALSGTVASCKARYLSQPVVRKFQTRWREESPECWITRLEASSSLWALDISDADHTRLLIVFPSWSTSSVFITSMPMRWIECILSAFVRTGNWKSVKNPTREDVGDNIRAYTMQSVDSRVVCRMWQLPWKL